MCTVLLLPGGYPIAVKYIISYHIISYIVSYHIISYHLIVLHGTENVKEEKYCSFPQNRLSSRSVANNNLAHAGDCDVACFMLEEYRWIFENRLLRKVFGT